MKPVFLFAALIGMAAPAAAAPQTFVFSGTLYSSWLNPATNAPSWSFAAGQSFTGRFTLDLAQLSFSWRFIDTPQHQASFHYNVMRDFQITVDTPAPYTVTSKEPSRITVQNGGTFEGAHFVAQNHPVGGVPTHPLAPGEAIDHLIPHSMFFNLNGDRDLLDDDGPDVDWDALYAGLEGIPFARTMAIRFTDPAAPSWAIYNETVTGTISGEVTSFRRLDAVAPVPEPASWALMLTGFFGAGAAIRRVHPRVAAPARAL